MFLLVFAGCNKDKPAQTEFCDSATCNQYFLVWKSLFMQRNNMTEKYFDKHIFPYKTLVNSWVDGESFSVQYQVRIDWMVCHTADNFIIKANSELYPALNIPRYTYLNQAEINAAIDAYAFSSDMNVIQSIDHLYFGSPKKTVQFAQDQASNNSVHFSDYRFYQAKPVFTPNGHPYMHCFGTVDEDQNQCVEVIINLHTGTSEVINGSCSVN